MRYAINGLFLSQKLTGIQRFSIEIIKELDKIAKPNEFVIVAPNREYDEPKLQNIEIIKIGKRDGLYWEQIELGKYLRRHKELVNINLCNDKPLFTYPGITVLHDVICRVNPDYFPNIRNKLSRLWHILQYRYITNVDRTIVTVSNYSKTDIEKYYPAAVGKIKVIYNGWQHIDGCNNEKNNKAFSTTMFQKYPFIANQDYYFSMATLSRNKNGKWIFNVARKNQSETFVMAGARTIKEKLDVPENVHLLGYVSDDEAKWLIRHCKAFLFPSLYEGFGIPPLEALALGAKVIISNQTSLPEIYGDCAYYINPLDYNVNLDELMREPVGDCQAILDKYSWKKSAEEIRKIIEESMNGK